MQHMQEEAWRVQRATFLLKLFEHTSAWEPELFYLFWSSDSINTEDKPAGFFFNAATTVLRNPVRAVQPWLACKNGRLFILLSNIPAWQLSQSIPGWMSSFHNNFSIQVDFSLSSAQNTVRQASYLLILLWVQRAHLVQMCAQRRSMWRF